jgi:hypothetical protein
MANKLIVGQSEWEIADQDAASVVKQVREAMDSGTSAELQLNDGKGKSVTVFLNARVVPIAVLELGEDARPSEMS